MELNGVKVALPLMEFDDDECLNVYKKLKFEYDVFKFVYNLARCVTHVVEDTMEEYYSTMFCINGYLYENINYYVYLSSMIHEKQSSRVILRASVIDIYGSCYAECDYVFHYGLHRKVDIATNCNKELCDLFMRLINYFTNCESYKSIEDIQECFKERSETLISFRLLHLVEYYYTMMRKLSGCCCPYSVKDVH